MIKAIALVRTSTVKQEVESQKKEVLEFAKEHGFKSNEIMVIGCAGASAIKLDDQYMYNMREVEEVIAKGGIECVFAWAIDRIGRNEIVLQQFKKLLVDNGVNLVIKNPSIELLNNDGTVNAGMELAFSLFVTMAKQEMEMKQQRFKRARARNREEGICVGKKAPFGYTLDATRHIVPHPEESLLVRRIFEDHARGRGYKDMVLDYGLPNTTIERLFHNDIYIGGRSNIVGIVSKDLWDKCQEINTEVVVKRFRNGSNVYWSKTITKCPLCGYSMHTDVHYFKYYCVRCDKSVNLNIIESICWAVASKLYLNMMSQNNAETRRQYLEKKQLTLKDVEKFRNQIAAMDKRSVKLEQDYYVEAKISESRYISLSEQLKSNRSEIQKRIDELNKAIETLDNVLNHKEVKTESLDTLNDIDKKEIVTRQLQYCKPLRIDPCTVKFIILPRNWVDEIEVVVNTRKHQIISSVNFTFPDNWYIKRFEKKTKKQG